VPVGGVSVMTAWGALLFAWFYVVLTLKYYALFSIYFQLFQIKKTFFDDNQVLVYKEPKVENKSNILIDLIDR
jgi:hypothetical protein